MAVFKSSLQENPNIKPRTKEYYEFRIAALLKSWSGLAAKDVARISSADCLDWSAKNARENSSSSHNLRMRSSSLRILGIIVTRRGSLFFVPVSGCPRSAVASPPRAPRDWRPRRDPPVWIKGHHVGLDFFSQDADQTEFVGGGELAHSGQQFVQQHATTLGRMPDDGNSGAGQKTANPHSSDQRRLAEISGLFRPRPLPVRRHPATRKVRGMQVRGIRLHPAAPA